MTTRILTLLDQPDADVVETAAAPIGADVVRVTTVGGLLEALRGSGFAATFLSLQADHADETLVDRIAGLPATGALLLSEGGASLEAALLTERVGATALLREPLEPEKVRVHLEELSGEGKSIELPPEETGDDGSPGLVGRSAAMANVFGLIARVARSTSTVLITGESGTGKEVVARTLHRESERHGHPFVAVNCAAIPEHLLESELFGHEKGAFTGAVARRAGRFERAHGGTLFLDEIGDMSLVLQAKVLRVLEERQVERVGSQTTESVDVRVIAATNQRLAEAIAEGRFREDLYYRLGVVEIDLPPLRDRGDDVRLLALHFAAHFAKRHRRPIRAISVEALTRIEGASWPGNVRELRNVMDRAVLLTTGDTIRSGSLRMGTAAPRTSSTLHSGSPPGYPPTASLAEVEADHIRKVLGSVDGQIGKAADILGIHRNTLSRKIREHGLDGSSARAGG